MKLAIQIILYNSSEDLPVLIRSLEQQTFQDFEIFFYQNFDSFLEMNICGKMIRSSGLTCHHITAKENSGFAGGHARLFELHQAPFILLINDDVRLEPQYIVRVMNRIKNDDNIGSVTGLIYRWDEKTIDTAGLEYKSLAQIRDRLAGESVSSLHNLQSQEVFGVSGAVGLYRRSAIERAGSLFDPTWFMYKEDVDLALRLKKVGFTAWFEPTAVGFHKRGLKQAKSLIHRWLDERKRPKKLRIYAYANQLKIYRKHFHWSLGWKDILQSFVIEKIRSIGIFIASPSVFYQAWKILSLSSRGEKRRGNLFLRKGSEDGDSLQLYDDDWKQKL